jgi:transglutaminase-like putative cysteine protease
MTTVSLARHALALILLFALPAGARSEKVVRYEVLTIAMGGHEVGTLEIRDIDTGAGLRHERKTDLALKRGAATLEIQSTSVSVTDPEGRPLRYQYTRTGASGDAKSEGFVENGVLFVRTTQAGATVKDQVPVKDLMFATTFEHRARQAKVGFSESRRVFVEELGAVTEMKARVEKDGAGRKVVTSMKSLETIDLVDAAGRLKISRTEALGSIAYPRGATPPPEVKAGKVDVLAASTWPAPAVPRTAKVVRYRVHTPDAERFTIPEDLRQRILGRTAGTVDIEVKMGPVTKGPLKDRAAHLEETPYEPVKDSRIKYAAELQTKGKKTPRDKIGALVRYVYNHVEEKALDRGYAPAPLTLESRRGDCTEHSVLLSALLRSQGIPTRLVDGVVITGGRAGYHEWVEVFVDGEGFLAADPTFGEFPASPLRLKLAEGSSSPEGLLELGVAAGRLLRPGVRVEVLDFER